MRAASTSLLLVCGLPGSGKTTVARSLARERRAVRLCPDEWLAGLGLDLFDEPARDRLEGVLWQHAQELLHLDQSVILESGFWGRSERDDKRRTARALGVRVELHVLDLPLDELWRRVRIRNAAAPPGGAVVTHEQLIGWSGWFEAPSAAERALFDPAH